MQGVIKTFLPTKGFGFIVGDDGKDYFLHASQLINGISPDQLIEGARVAFEEDVTPKGYRAKGIRLLQSVDTDRIMFPPDIVMTKDAEPRGWEVLTVADWVLTSTTRESPDDARDELHDLARKVGANAVLGMRYHKSTGAEGTGGRGVHHFTIHHFAGRPAMVGRRHAQGEKRIQDIPDLDANCRKAHVKILRDRHKSIIISVVLKIAMIAIATDVGKETGFVFGVAAAFFFFNPQPKAGWLKHVTEVWPQ